MRFIIFSFMVLILMAGCATIKDAPKGFAGLSTKALEDNRKQAITRAFNFDSDTCYKKTKEVLAELGAYIYAQDKKKNMIAFYLSGQDTTPVGVFFKKIDENVTQVEVSSSATHAREYIAPRLFSGLAKDNVK
jgi:hypothetical protein